jgi:hypothetical protein
MTIYPFKSTTPFASTIDVNYFKYKENEVLFSMHTIFRKHDIEPMNKNDCLFQMDLTLTSDNDKDLLIAREKNFSKFKRMVSIGFSATENEST